MTEKQSLNDWLTELEQFTIPSYEEWEKVALASLKGKPMDQLFTKTYEGIMLKPVYTKKDAEHGIPQYDKTSICNTWNISQEIEGPTIVEAIKSIQQAIKFGQTSVHFRLRTPGEAVGIRIKHKVDVYSLLDSLSPENLSFLINTRLLQSPFIASVLSYQRERNIELSGVIGNDPIGEWVQSGKLPSSLTYYYEEMAAVLKQVQNTKIKTIFVQSQPVHNGGANAVQELAFTLSVAIEYVRQCLERGLSIDEVAPHIAFSFSVSSNLFMEVAKLRAAKYLWASIVNQFGGSEESREMWIHARTSSTTKTKYDPYVNMLRATVETFTAVIGGANSIHTSTFDEPYNTSSQFSERIARNVQSILMDESHLHRVMDPSSGSWYIESLTKQLAEKTWEYIQTIEQKGGVLNALYEGFIQDEVKHTRNVRFDKINHRKERIVGTNMYPNINEVEVGLHEKIHLNQESVKRITPQDIKYTFSDEDFFQQLEDVIDRGALFQEVADGLLFEEKEQHIESIPFIRWSMKFEELRDHAKANYKKTGEEWSVQIINLGELVTHKPRTDFTKGFFEVGGFKLSESPSLLTVEELEFAIKKVDRHVFVICGSDQTYSEMGLTVTKLIKQHSPSATIFLAGKLSDDQLKDYQNAGLDDCVHINTNCYKFLLNLQSKMEGFHENA